MGVAVWMEWPGVTQQQYDQVMALLGLDSNPPVGGNFHSAGFTRDGLFVFDIWESQQAFEDFQRDRLTTAVNTVGISSHPKVRFVPIHNLYLSNTEAIRKAGASSLPPVKA